MAGVHPGAAQPAHTEALRFAWLLASSVAPVFHARRLVFSDRRAQAPAEIRVQFVNWPDWCGAYYCRQVLRHDPIRHWLDAARDPEEDCVARLSDLVPGRSRVASRFPDERLGACGARHVLTIALHDAGELLAALSLVRGDDEGDFSAADCRLARAMAPVLGLAWRGACTGPALEPAGGPLACLTPREREVAMLVAQGLCNKAIARQLQASPWTVKNHLRAVFRKTGVANRTALGAAVHAVAHPASLALSASAACSPVQCD